MADYESQGLLHITKNGKQNTMIKYSGIPHQICRFGSHILAISTDIGVNLHKIQ